MRFELQLALRFLREGRTQSALIVGGVMVGVAVIVFISALVTGLPTNTFRRTLGAQAHIVSKPIEPAARVQSEPSDSAIAVVQTAPVSYTHLGRFAGCNRYQLFDCNDYQAVVFGSYFYKSTIGLICPKRPPGGRSRHKAINAIRRIRRDVGSRALGRR